MKITRDDKHIYRVDGVVKPSVTEILRDEGVIDLRRIPIESLRAARELGKEVHRVIRLFLTGKLKIDTIDAVVAPYFKAFLTFTKDFGFDYIEVENILYSKQLDICGEPDVIGVKKSEPNHFYLIDWKSTTTIQDSVYIQTALYERIWNENHIVDKKKIWRRIIAQLLPTGKCNSPEAKDTIDGVRGMSAVIMWKYKEERGLHDDAKYTKEIFGGEETK